MITVYFRGTSAQVRAAIYLAVQIAAGKAVQGAARDYSIAISTLAGNALLANIKTNFEQKSKGLVGVDGEKWTPLLAATVLSKLAKHKKAMAGKSAVAVERRARRDEYLDRIAKARAQLSAGIALPSKQLPSHYRDQMMRMRRKSIERQAAILVGWYPHEVFAMNPGVLPFALTLILRDTGVLFASLSAGHQGKPYNGPSATQQVFVASPGDVIVGSNVPYIGPHQYGAPAAGIPQRQILPDVIPTQWWVDIADAVAGGIATLIQMFLRGRP